MTPADLAARAIGVLGDRARVLIAVAGSPGSGKTTLARRVVAAIDEVRGPGFAAALPMDGFHLPNATLDALGRRGRKGAIDTFDAAGFVNLLGRVARDTDETVTAPAFERAIDEPVPDAISIAPTVRIVVVEGNYLLVGDEPWRGIHALAAESWFVATDERTRLARLVDRHTRHGRTPEDAAAWANDVDGANSRLIEPTRARADLLVPGDL